MIYDTIIIGAGAAGCSAAIYATRYNLKTLMLGGMMPGGLITEALDVENYPGYLSISGMDLANKFLDQAVKLGTEYKVEVAENITPETDEQGNKIYKVTTPMGVYFGSTIILAMGTHHRKLNIPGEEQFAGRGVSYCATCDGPFFKNKIVAVTGGGNSAVEAAKDLSVHAEKVYLIYRSELKAAPVYIDQMRQQKNIVEIAGTNIVEVKGGSLVEQVVIDKVFNGQTELNVNGLFVQIGYIPKNDLASKLGVQLSEYGYVKVDAGMGTSVAGVFCAGDLNDGSNGLHQQVTSAAEGAISAQSAYRYIQSIPYLTY